MTNKDLELARNGDQNAINRIFIDNNHLLTQIARKYYLVGGDVEDIIQEGRLGLYKAINIFDESRNDSFEGFASKMIKREIINAIKRENTSKHKVLDESMFVDDDDCLHCETYPEQELILAERFESIKKKMFDNLSDFERQVLDYYLQDYKCKDIAKIIGEDYKKVENAITRAKDKLAKFKEDK